MACQELSYQQVMSYLVGGGDHYHSHIFASLPWSQLDCYFHSSQDNNDLEEDESPETETVNVHANTIVSHDVITDYRLRPIAEPFQSMSLWRFVEIVEKISLSQEDCCVRQANDNHQTRCTDHLDIPW